MKKLLLAATILSSCAVPSMAKSLDEAVQENQPADIYSDPEAQPIGEITVTKLDCAP
jgi:hypothetical protein